MLEHAVDHVLDCVEKLLGALDSGKHGKTPLEFEQATHKAASRGLQHREPQTDGSSPSASGKESWIGHKLHRFDTLAC